MTDNTGRDHVRATDAHELPELRLPPSLLAPASSSEIHAKRVVIPRLSVGDGFQVFDLLSEKECAGLVALAEENSFKSITWEYDPVRLGVVIELMKVIH